MRQLRVGKARQNPPDRVLRKRRQGNRVGGHVTTRAFFEDHKINELEQWPDHDLEEQGRLTLGPVMDKYMPVTWIEAFEVDTHWTKACSQSCALAITGDVVRRRWTSEQKLRVSWRVSSRARRFRRRPWILMNTSSADGSRSTCASPTGTRKSRESFHLARLSAGHLCANRQDERGYACDG